MTGTRGRIVLIILIATLAAAPAAAEQRGGPRGDKAVSMNPIGLLGTFGGLLDLQYEMRRSADNSIALRADIGGQSWGAYNSYTAFGVGGMYRMWPGKKALREWYWGPAASVNFLSITVQDPRGVTSNSSSGVAVGIGAEGGYQYIFPSGILLDGSLGLRLVIGSLKASVGNYSSTVPLSGLGFFLRGGVGYAWK